jgi:hypothetical protein
MGRATERERIAKVEKGLKRLAELDSEIEGLREAQAAELMKAAADWRQRATDGRVAGLDREIRELYIRKAEAAEASAERLRRGDVVKAVDLARAAKLEAEASAFERKADGTSTGDLSRYYRMRARDLREAAAIARGEKLAFDSQGKHLVSGS